ncbi:MAG: DUF4384 domain-containing protein [Gloeocapsa sp. DLM2.Bin57]|nr:MAG: DUF4384 domain-containing protein [Gloeocapsa sp. DLM2.Bin57]
MRIERRRFLQQTGLAILTLGTSQLTLPGFNRYVQTLAATTNRKLALLVGINQYPHYPQLNGCLTDVELQKELLIHRFNFQPQDIVTLTEKEATRENIETAFTEHLIKQAKATDIVVFHFSGYGSLASLPNQTNLPSLVPVDSSFPNKKNSTSNHLLEKTLVLLAQSLPTDKVTLVLDTSYAIPSQLLLGNLKVRSLLPPGEQQENISEVAFAEQIRLGIPSTKKNLQPILLHAGAENQLAVEQRWQNFSAGLFTYNLTQDLWSKIPPTNLITSLAQATANIATVMGSQQQPQLSKPALTSDVVYYLKSQSAFSAHGYLSSIGEEPQVNLLGLPATVLQNYGANSLFAIPELKPEQYLQLHSLNKFTSNASWLGDNPPKNLKVGQVVQEYLRVLPKDVKLAIALDNSLERIERVDATSALVNLDLVDGIVNPGEQWADCLLAKTSTGYGLLTQKGNLIPKTTGEVNEAIKSAVTRLTPNLAVILAAKLSRLTLNQASSRLPVEVSLTIFDQRNQMIWQKISQSGGKQDKITRKNPGQFLPSIPINKSIQYRLTNQGNNPIYFILLSILPDHQAIALYTPPLNQKTLPSVVNPGETRVIPNPNNSFTWKTSEPLGITETLVICSDSPFKNTLETLGNQQQTLGNKETIVLLLKPLGVIQAILTDLDNASQAKSKLIPNSADNYTLAVTHWASLSFVINTQ